MSSDTHSDARTHYWQQQVAAWQASGQSQQAFCKDHALNYGRFGYWLHKFRRQTMLHFDTHLT